MECIGSDSGFGEALLGEGLSVSMHLTQLLSKVCFGIGPLPWRSGVHLLGHCSQRRFPSTCSRVHWSPYGQPTKLYLLKIQDPQFLERSDRFGGRRNWWDPILHLYSRCRIKMKPAQYRLQCVAKELCGIAFKVASEYFAGTALLFSTAQSVVTVEEDGFPKKFVVTLEIKNIGSLSQADAYAEATGIRVFDPPGISLKHIVDLANPLAQI